MATKIIDQYVKITTDYRKINGVSDCLNQTVNRFENCVKHINKLTNENAKVLGNECLNRHKMQLLKCQLGY